MDQVVGVALGPVDHDPIIPTAPGHRHEGHPRRAHRLQAFDDAAVGMGDHHAVALPLVEQGADDGGHPLHAGHVAVRLDVHQPRELVDDPLVAFVGVGHQVDGHGSQELGDPEHRCRDLRAVAQADIARTVDLVLPQPQGDGLRRRGASLFGHGPAAPLFTHQSITPFPRTRCLPGSPFQNTPASER